MVRALGACCPGQLREVKEKKVGACEREGIGSAYRAFRGGIREVIQAHPKPNNRDPIPLSGSVGERWCTFDWNTSLRN